MKKSFPYPHQLDYSSSVMMNGGSFQISKEESSRYKELLSGPRGFQSPNIDPLTLLGIESRNDVERRNYAELWVKQEYERTEKELKFQREVDAAWKRLMPNMLPVNMGNAAGIAHVLVAAWRCLCAKQIASAMMPDSPLFSPINIPLISTSLIVKAAIRNSATGHNSTAFPPNKFVSAVSP